MFDHTVFRDNSPAQFKRACSVIEREFPDCHKQKLLIDVDGSTIQTYSVSGKEITVYDDYFVGAVYIKSEIDLNRLFE